MLCQSNSDIVSGIALIMLVKLFSTVYPGKWVTNDLFFFTGLTFPKHFIRPQQHDANSLFCNDSINNRLSIATPFSALQKGDKLLAKQFLFRVHEG